MDGYRNGYPIFHRIEVDNMKTWLIIPVVLMTFVGCVFWGETREKTLTARQVTEENVFSYGSVAVKVNPDLRYMNISGNIKIEIMGKASTPTKREFHIFTRPGIDNIVFIETHTRSNPHTFNQPQNITKKMETIQKGQKPIDGRTWEAYIRSHPRFPEQIVSAAKQKGVLIDNYRCGLEIGVARVTNPYNRIYISYLKGINDCTALPQNGGVLSDNQVKMIREFSRQFDENIAISN
jgi:hypothetical protein